ncbi:MAG: 16S rRNA (uracil(1498)-N(3))-methyltransferase [Lachnospiraceae bacterium]|nr:16S rRNA (uracil(1498)-N(3))-methyltransferase [Lachnospiraceae bacterium]
MYRFFVERSACMGDCIRIGGDDWNHMKNVLRLKCGEQITVSDGTDREYICEIIEYVETEAVVKILDILDSSAELPTEITLYQGFPKGDKMELIIQKAVELGASRIVPVMTKRTIVKLDAKKAEKKLERYNAIALSAAKQSKRGVIPVVDRIMTMKEALEDARGLEMNLIPYEDAKGMQHSKEVLRQVVGKKTLGIFIGPEGGFEEAEVQAAIGIGAECITLGHRILRTETAGMTVLSIVMFELEQD